jgi:hypothetical protein
MLPATKSFLEEMGVKEDERLDGFRFMGVPFSLL